MSHNNVRNQRGMRMFSKLNKVKTNANTINHVSV